MNYNLCKLNFRFRARFGHTGYELENTTEYISSDRLFSAIFIEWKDIYGIEDAKQFLIKEDFRISNAFPYISQTLFFPRPRLNITKDNMSDDFYEQNRKKIKGLTYLTKNSIEKILNGQKLGEKEIEKELDSYSDLKKSLVTDFTQKVAIDNMSDNRLFRVKELYFDKEAGLFFIYKIQKEAEEKLKKVLLSIGYTGIGSDRSTGSGCFEAIFDSTEFKSDNSGTLHYTLSEIIPQQDELDKLAENINSSGYGLVKKGGRVHEKGTFKVPGYAFSAGSVFPFDINGHTQCFNEPEFAHEVYCYGKAVSFPVKGGF